MTTAERDRNLTKARQALRAKRDAETLQKYVDAKHRVQHTRGRVEALRTHRNRLTPPVKCSEAQWDQYIHADEAVREAVFQLRLAEQKLRRLEQDA